MNNYNINIREILETSLDIEAENLEAAIDKVNDMYKTEEIVLYPEDYVETIVSGHIIKEVQKNHDST